MAKNYKLLIINVLIGIFFTTITNQSNAQDDLGTLISKLSKEKESSAQSLLAKQIGLLYEKEQGYKSAIPYFQKSYEIEKSTNRTENQRFILEHLANCYLYLKDYKNASNYFLQKLDLERREKNTLMVRRALSELAQVNVLAENFKQAIDYQQEILMIDEKQQNLAQLSETYNNIGYAYKKLNNRQEALVNFGKALNYYFQQAKEESNHTEVQAVVYQNIGVTYTNLENYTQAKEYYQKALNIRENQKNFLGKAKIYNYLAINDYLNDRNENALAQVQEAVLLAEPELNGKNSLKAQETLSASYQILANLYQQEGDMKEYQRNYQKYLNTQEALNQVYAQQKQALTDKQIEISKRENELKLDIADKEMQAMELAQVRLENEKREQELALLKEREASQAAQLRTQRLEAAQAKQQLMLLAQQTNAAKQQQQIAELEKERTVKELLSNQQKAEQQKKVQLLEQDKKLQEIQAKEAKKQQELTTRASLIGGVSAFVIIVIILVSLVNNWKKNKLLAQSNDDIQEKNKQLESLNTELNQTQEEIMAQRDAIEEKNKELNSQNVKISSSINAAVAIQTAMLPYQSKMRELLNDHFVIYRPRDVVSGDFYWLNRVVIQGKSRVILAAVDCTGHGVPGALMSSIGKSLLDKIVLVYDISDPAQILENLHKEVNEALQHEDSRNLYGMDLAICMLKKMKKSTRTKVTFSAAKRPLFYVQASEKEIKTLQGDRRSIGGEQNRIIPFTNQILRLKKGSIFYLCSDGFADQNNQARTKLGENYLKQKLLEVSHLPMGAQKAELEAFLDKHQEGTDQRDDILLIGVRV
jgi:serine phosphatase RsbU (regulator of sigma subunit)/tetratricopeptide (TPR) repeat protein